MPQYNSFARYYIYNDKIVLVPYTILQSSRYRSIYIPGTHPHPSLELYLMVQQQATG